MRDSAGFTPVFPRRQPTDSSGDAGVIQGWPAGFCGDAPGTRVATGPRRQAETLSLVRVTTANAAQYDVGLAAVRSGLGEAQGSYLQGLPARPR